MDLISDRRALHRIPELDRDLPETLGYLRSVLEPLPCLLFSPAKSALCAFFDFGQDHSLAFRADMDALPVAEETGLPFASCHPGRMHACGHDGHMAIVLELAGVWPAAQPPPQRAFWSSSLPRRPPAEPGPFVKPGFSPSIAPGPSLACTCGRTFRQESSPPCPAG